MHGTWERNSKLLFSSRTYGWLHARIGRNKYRFYCCGYLHHVLYTTSAPASDLPQACLLQRQVISRSLLRPSTFPRRYEVETATSTICLTAI